MSERTNNPLAMILGCFDYMYYRTYDIYQRKWKENMPWIYALCFVSLMQILNIMIVGLSLFALLQVKLGVEKITILGLCAVIIGYNYSRYKRITFGELEKRWKDESFQQRKRRGWLIILYILISFPITMFLFAELGKINNAL